MECNRFVRVLCSTSAYLDCGDLDFSPQDKYKRQILYRSALDLGAMLITFVLYLEVEPGYFFWPQKLLFVAE